MEISLNENFNINIMILVLQNCVHEEVHLGITQRQKWLSDYRSQNKVWTFCHFWSKRVNWWKWKQIQLPTFENTFENCSKRKSQGKCLYKSCSFHIIYMELLSFIIVETVTSSLLLHIANIHGKLTSSWRHTKSIFLGGTRLRLVHVHVHIT